MLFKMVFFNLLCYSPHLQRLYVNHYLQSIVLVNITYFQDRFQLLHSHQKPVISPLISMPTNLLSFLYLMFSLLLPFKRTNHHLAYHLEHYLEFLMVLFVLLHRSAPIRNISACCLAKLLSLNPAQLWEFYYDCCCLSFFHHLILLSSTKILFDLHLWFLLLRATLTKLTHSLLLLLIVVVTVPELIFVIILIARGYFSNRFIWVFQVQ